MFSTLFIIGIMVLVSAFAFLELWGGPKSKKKVPWHKRGKK